MNKRRNISVTGLCALLLGASLAGCDNRQQKAQSAYADYQAAVVSGDPQSARQALGALVAADDSNADYWIELGKLSMQLSDYGTAYDAYQRAHELDRANIDVLSIMTQLALRSGNLVIAEENARQLELVAPDNPAVPLTKGYAAMRRSDLAEAEKQAALFTELSPYDSSGKVLQARIYMAKNEPDRAIKLLSDQIAAQPSDSMSLRALASIYELKERWPEAAATLRNYLNWQKADEEARVRLIEFELRSDQVEAAKSVTMAGIGEGDVDALLGPWIALGRQQLIADQIYSWAQTQQTGRRIAAARFLSMTGQPDRVKTLVAPEATLPVTPGNVIPNALFGAALVQSGRLQEGSARLNEVLRVDGTVREALLARAQLRSRAGAHKLAIEDAQKLVAADRSSAQYRLFLARIYGAAGNRDGVRRTLWDGFHDIAADRSIYDALRPVVASSDGPQAAVRLSEEFYDQRNDRITRSFT